MGSFLWATYGKLYDNFFFLFIVLYDILLFILASVVFLGDSQPQAKKALAVYPIFLFYFIMSWLVLSHTV